MEFIFAEPDTILVFTIFYKLFGGGTRLAMPKTICASDSSSLKPSSGATEGVLDKGVSEQPNYIHRSDYRSVKIQDFGSCTDGTVLCMEDKLDDPDIMFPSL